MFDPGLQRLPPTAVHEALERKQHEFEAEAEHDREVHEARAARREHSRIRAALRRIRHAIGRHR